MHYLGILGVPRRYYALGNTEFLPQSVHTINAAITIAALIVAGSVILFLYNMIVEPVERREGPAESLEGDHARVADAGHAAASRQLGPAPAGRASLGLRLQRAGRSGRLHPAERPGRFDATRPAPATAKTAPPLSNTAIVVALLVGFAVWFAVASRLTAKPWENREQQGDVGALHIPPARIGLWFFMAVVTSLFALFLSAYSMRMHHSVGWCHLTIPGHPLVQHRRCCSPRASRCSSPRTRSPTAAVSSPAPRWSRPARCRSGSWPGRCSPGARSGRRCTSSRAAPRSRSSTS